MELQHWTWVQPSVKQRYFELQTGNDILATLEWVQRFGTLAEATSANGNWTFERIGFWKPRVCVRTLETNTELALFLPKTFSWKGSLTFSDGREYLWDMRGFWKQTYTWKTPEQDDLLRFEGGQGLLKFGATVEVLPMAASISELPLLATLGFYMMMLLSYASAASTSTVVAATT